MSEADGRSRLVPFGLRRAQLRSDRRVFALRPRFGFQLDPYLLRVDAAFNVRVTDSYQVLKPLQIDLMACGEERRNGGVADAIPKRTFTSHDSAPRLLTRPACRRAGRTPER